LSFSKFYHNCPKYEDLWRACFLNIEQLHACDIPHFFTINSLAYFDPDHIICQRYDYSSARFKQEKLVFNETLQNRWTKKIVLKFANRWPWQYEFYLSHFYPLDDISFYLRKPI
jgi:hypothetical protein